jgi:hypothetical protein
VKTAEDYNLLVKEQTKRSEDEEIVLINLPLKFPADCRIITVPRSVFDKKYFVSVQDFDTTEMSVANAVEEIDDFTKGVRKEQNRVGYQVLEIESLDAAHAAELQIALATQLGQHFFFGQHRLDKHSHHWFVAICSAGALVVPKK